MRLWQDCTTFVSGPSAWEFRLEHIIARKHGGQETEDNLGWSCIFCNLYKGPSPASFDPDTGQLTQLFHPRRDKWEEHFCIQEARIVGLTAKGRVSVWLLEMNSNILTSLRTSLMKEGRW